MLSVLMLETGSSTASVIPSQRLSAVSVLLEMLESCGQPAQLFETQAQLRPRLPSTNYSPRITHRLCCTLLPALLLESQQRPSYTAKHEPHHHHASTQPYG